MPPAGSLGSGLLRCQPQPDAHLPLQRSGAWGRRCTAPAGGSQTALYAETLRNLREMVLGLELCVYNVQIPLGRERTACTGMWPVTRRARFLHTSTSSKA